MLAPAPHWLKHPFSLLLGSLTIAVALIIISCGGGPAPMQSLASGTVTVSISDPPSCSVQTGATAAAMPSRTFSNVWVTIVSVKAHISATADPTASGWQELAPQLNSAPMQVNLLKLPAQGQCLLAQLGSAELPAGDYQQIRLILLANAATSTLPSPNKCAQLGNVFNCAEDAAGNFHELKLASEAQTGLKVPPGQMMGGPLHVAAGQSVDLNIDFDACASITPSFTLKPALTAGVVSPNMSGISGQIVDSVTSKPIVGATVTLQSPDMTGVDRIVAAPKVTDSTGHFRFCPLPAQAFDVVVDAMTSSTAYDATAIFNVTGGTDLGAIPLVAETPATPGASTGPGTIQGTITAINGTAGANIDATLSALQTVMVSGASHTITVPLFANSTSNVSITSSTSCPTGAPKGAFCGSYTLIVPASNPEVGTFSAGKVTFTAPATGDVLYTVEANAANPTTNAAMCSPASQTATKDTSTQPAPLKVTPGATTNAAEIDFSGCS